MPQNLITDVAGIRVGHADDVKLASGVTAVVFDRPVIASGDIRGGGPGTRETDLLDPAMTVEKIDAIVLAGGSAFGLDAASGTQAWLREQGRGFAMREALVPIVPSAILFDLLNGGDKKWGRYPPYRELGYTAAFAADTEFSLGSVGAGLGALTLNLKGGMGSASDKLGDITIAALTAVNPAGSVTVGDSGQVWAAPFEQNNEFGGRGFPHHVPAEALVPRTRGSSATNTTLSIVATDAILTKAQARFLAVMAQDGIARAIYPVHTPLDGDSVFTVSTGVHRLGNPVFDLMRLGAIAANVVARSVARGVYEASALPFAGTQPAYKDKFR